MCKVLDETSGLAEHTLLGVNSSTCLLDRAVPREWPQERGGRERKGWGKRARKGRTALGVPASSWPGKVTERIGRAHRLTRSGAGVKDVKKKTPPADSERANQLLCPPQPSASAPLHSPSLTRRRER